MSEKEAGIHLSQLNIVPESHQLPQFVGREAEIQACEQHLELRKIAIIKGRAGIGKSYLLAALATKNPDKKILWLDCARLNPTLDDLLWAIASTLASKPLLEFLDADRYVEYPPTVKQGRFFFELLRLESHHILCFDNLHYWYSVRPLVNFILDLKDHLQSTPDTQLSIILLTQETPPFLHEPVFDFLSGISRTDLAYLFQAQGLNVSSDLLNHIHHITQGHPAQAVLIAQQILQTNTQIVTQGLLSDQLAEKAITNQAIENEIAFSTYNTLSNQEKYFLQAVALLNEPATLDMLKYILQDEDIQHVKDHHRTLINKFLLQKIDSFSHTVTLSPLDRAFYRDVIDLQFAQRLHRKATRYYELQGEDQLAQYHRLKILTDN